MELMGHDEFIQSLKRDIPEEELDSIKDNRLGTFPITNRGIQIWLFLRPCRISRTRFEAWLPCRRRPWAPPETIKLVFSESNYYRDPGPDLWTVIPCFSSLDTTSSWSPSEPLWQLCQVHLKYQDPPRCNTTFKIDDRALIEYDFTYCNAYPKTHAHANQPQFPSPPDQLYRYLRLS